MAVTPLDPHTLDSLEAEYDAREIAGLSNGDPVSTWPQSASGGLNDAVASGGDRPEYVAVDQNGLPGVEFDGTERLTIASITSSAERTVIAVARIKTAGGNQGLFSWWNSSSSRGSCIMRANSSSQRFGWWSSSVSWQMASNPSYVLPLDETHVLTWAWESGVSDSLMLNTDRADRIYPGQSSPGTVPAGSTGILGGNQPSDPTFQGVANHILIFNERLTRAQIEGVQAWLAAIWDPPKADRWTYTPPGTPATGHLDFADDTIDENPAGCTERWNASDHWLVKEHAGATNGRVVQCNAGNSVMALSIDALNGETDVEIKVRALGPSGPGAVRPGVAVRSHDGIDSGSNRPNDSLIYRARDGAGEGPWNLRERVLDSTTVRDWVFGPSRDDPDWHFLVTRIENDLVYARGWDETQDDPEEWRVVTEAEAVGGWHGVDAFQSNSYVDWIAWGTKGATAVDPTLVQVNPTIAETVTTAPDPAVVAVGSTTALPTTAQTTTEAPNPTAAAGARTQPTTAQTETTAPDPTVTAAQVAEATPTTAQTVSTAPDPTVAAGAVAYPTTATTQTLALDPSVQTFAGVRVEVASAAQTETTALDPTVEVASIAQVEPTAAVTATSAPDPNVSIAAGAIAQPSAAQTVTTAPDPTVFVPSGAEVTPDTAETVTTAPDPSVGAIVLPELDESVMLALWDADAGEYLALPVARCSPLTRPAPNMRRRFSGHASTNVTLGGNATATGRTRGWEIELQYLDRWTDARADLERLLTPGYRIFGGPYITDGPRQCRAVRPILEATPGVSNGRIRLTLLARTP